ncbi:MAG: hypothetical protein ACLQJ7_12740, partial [Syntrophobacteraceae bacterium]
SQGLAVGVPYPKGTGPDSDLTYSACARVRAYIMLWRKVQDGTPAKTRASHPLAATRLFKSSAAAAAPRMRRLAADSAERSASRVSAWPKSCGGAGETFPRSV